MINFILETIIFLDFLFVRCESLSKYKFLYFRQDSWFQNLETANVRVLLMYIDKNLYLQ